MYANGTLADVLLFGGFLAWAVADRISVKRRTPDEARHILITLGGSDPADLTRLALRAFFEVAGTSEIRVLIGPENPREEALRAEARRVGLEESLLSGVEDVPGLLAWSDLAVTAAGSTCWELAFLGVPALTIAVAENQRPIAASLSQPESRGT
jgi:spore coat polysaccharide biosynthesis predicted glycosyltransferase SpsG